MAVSSSYCTKKLTFLPRLLDTEARPLNAWVKLIIQPRWYRTRTIQSMLKIVLIPSPINLWTPSHGNFRLRLPENSSTYLDMPRNFHFASPKNVRTYVQILIVDGISFPLPSRRTRRGGSQARLRYVKDLRGWPSRARGKFHQKFIRVSRRDVARKKSWKFRRQTFCTIYFLLFPLYTHDGILSNALSRG